MRLAFVLSDFYVHPEEQGHSVATVEALADLLRWARRQNLALDWRDWLARQWLGPAAAQATPSSSLARQTWELLSRATVTTSLPASCWFATPVHCRAGLNHVQLDARGCLRLSATEMAELLDDFARDFTGSGWQLIDGGDGRLLLGTEARMAAVMTQPPERWLGCNIASALPVGPGAARLRALAGEIELWLFDSSVNRQRAQHGLPPVTQLWLWDRLCSAVWMSPGSPALRIHGRDAALAALLEACGGKLHDLPPALDDLLAGDDSGAAALILPLQEFTGPDLHDFIDRWLAPARDRLQQGSLSTVQLLANERLFDLRARDRWRFWRRRRPWYRVLGP